MAGFGKTGKVHQVKFNPKTGKNDVFFGPKGMKPGHAVVNAKNGKVEYIRGAGNGVKASKDTKRFFGK